MTVFSRTANNAIFSPFLGKTKIFLKILLSYEFFFLVLCSKTVDRIYKYKEQTLKKESSLKGTRLQYKGKWQPSILIDFFSIKEGPVTLSSLSPRISKPRPIPLHSIS